LKLLVIGSGGREHAIAWRLAQSPRVQMVFVAPGNGGTALEPGLENVSLASNEALADFAQKEHVHLTVVGPEAPLAEGVVDLFRSRGLRIFGPTRACVQLESSKEFAKSFMQRHRIPTAAFASFTEPRAAHAYVDSRGAPIVIKADGLAAGKGVVVATNLQEAHQAIDMMRRLGAAIVPTITHPVEHGDVLELAGREWFVVHTPGHRPEMLSLLIINPPRSPEPSMVLTGDSLLVGDVGRPDFGGGDAAAQYESVARLLRLPDWVAVFPGHFEGPCGKGMCGRPSTTIGFERLYSPMVRLDAKTFVAALTESVPARPLNMTAIEATNRGLMDASWAMFTTAWPVEEVDVDAIDPLPSGALVIDVREPEEFAHGHVPGTVNLPQADLASRLDEVPRDRPVYVICHSGMRSMRAAQFLKQVGYERVFGVSGGVKAWQRAGRPLAFEDASAPHPRIIETEWMHAGGIVTSNVR